MGQMRQRMIEELRLRGYSERTVESYVAQMKRFAKHYMRPPEELGAEEIRAYLLHMTVDEELAFGTVNQAIYSLTPREHSSGNVRRLGRISKRGDAYLRTLLIHGARAVLLAAHRAQLQPTSSNGGATSRAAAGTTSPPWLWPTSSPALPGGLASGALLQEHRRPLTQEQPAPQRLLGERLTRWHNRSDRRGDEPTTLMAVRSRW